MEFSQATISSWVALIVFLFKPIVYNSPALYSRDKKWKQRTHCVEQIPTGIYLLKIKNENNRQPNSHINLFRNQSGVFSRCNKPLAVKACEKHRNFTWKYKKYRNFNTRKSGEITVFFAVKSSIWSTKYL